MEEIVHVYGDSAPLYDRGYSLGLTSMDGSTNVERYMLLYTYRYALVYLCNYTRIWQHVEVFCL